MQEVNKMNNIVVNSIDLTMKNDKKEIVKELILKYLMKQITKEQHS